MPRAASSPYSGPKSSRWGSVSMTKRHGWSPARRRHRPGAAAPPPARHLQVDHLVSWSSAMRRHRPAVGTKGTVWRTPPSSGLGLHLGDAAAHPPQPAATGTSAWPNGGRRRLEPGASHERHAAESARPPSPSPWPSLGSATASSAPAGPDNGWVERAQQTILEECCKPASPATHPKQTGSSSTWNATCDDNRACPHRPLAKGRTPEQVLGKATLRHKNR
jgi:hypothetical protein